VTPTDPPKATPAAPLYVCDKCGYSDHVGPDKTGHGCGGLLIEPAAPLSSEALAEKLIHAAEVLERGQIRWTLGIAGRMREAAAALTSLRADLSAAQQARDLERSRFASWAETFQGISIQIENGSEWGHMRAVLIGKLSAATSEFKRYAQGASSPSNFRKRAEAAEAQLTDARHALERVQQELQALKETKILARGDGVPDVHWGELPHPPPVVPSATGNDARTPEWKETLGNIPKKGQDVG